MQIFIDKAEVLHVQLSHHFDQFEELSRTMREIDQELCHHTNMGGWELVVWPLQVRRERIHTYTSLGACWVASPGKGDRDRPGVYSTPAWEDGNSLGGLSRYVEKPTYVDLTTAWEGGNSCGLSR